MKTIIKIISIASVSLILAACFTYGRDFNLSDVDRLVPGVSTYQQTVDILGTPQAVALVKDNLKQATWQYSKPAMGSLETKIVTLTFNKEGIYQGISASGPFSPK